MKISRREALGGAFILGGVAASPEVWAKRGTSRWPQGMSASQTSQPLPPAFDKLKPLDRVKPIRTDEPQGREIGRASCRERV